MFPRWIAFLLFVSLCAGCGAQVTPTPTAAVTATPLATPTAAPSPAPTRIKPTPTPAPGPRSFMQDFRSDPPYWTYLHVENGQPAPQPRIEDGFLAFDLASPNDWAYAIFSGHDYWNVTVSAHAQYRTSGDGAIGLVCRYNETKGWYELSVFADQTYALLYGQWLTNGVARYTPLYQGRSEKIQTDENEIGLGCQAQSLTPFINGTQLRTWQENKFGLSSGKVGLAVSSFSDAPFTVGFDWAKVSEP